MKKSFLEIKDLSVSFPAGEGQLKALPELSLSVYPREILAVAGSSGKSLLASAILGILPENAVVEGSMTFDGGPLTEERKARLQAHPGGPALCGGSAAGRCRREFPLSPGQGRCFHGTES